MQKVIIEKPYQFIPPHRGRVIPTCIENLRLVDKYLRRFEGIHSAEVRHADRLQASLDEGCGILLAPNHCRYADPLSVGWIAREVNVFVYAMASWHLFHQGWLQTLGIRLCGGFSVNREGLDRKSLDMAVQTLVDARRPLVVFAEGTIFRTNDLLNPLMDGVAFLARTAARKRQKDGLGKVVIHPVAMKYLFHGDLQATVEPVLESLEKQIGWGDGIRPGGLVERAEALQSALLALKELQFLGETQPGTAAERKSRLVTSLLEPLEQSILGRTFEADTIMPRVKQLRSKLLPELLKLPKEHSERREIWGKLSDIYAAQMISSFPIGYLDEPTDTRLLEIVEGLEEDLTDKTRVHRPLHAVLEIGEAIEVPPERGEKGQPDAITPMISQSIQSMLSRLAKESRPIERQIAREHRDRRGSFAGGSH